MGIASKDLLSQAEAPHSRESLQAKLARQSQHNLYTSRMRGGGDPFGPPFEPSVLSLYVSSAKLDRRRRGFWSFDALDELSDGPVNRFTRYAVGAFRQEYHPEALDVEPQPPPATGLSSMLQKFLSLFF
jgi:hypothetical protein